MSMKSIIVGAATVASLAGVAQAEDLLLIDLTTIDQVTITATGGLASAAASGSDTTGVYLENFYGGAGAGLVSSLVSGNLTSFNNPSDNSPSLFRAANDPGLNIWSFSSDATVSFAAGQQAFTGSATWTMSSALYADMLAGNSIGDIYFAADTADDLAGATVIGQYRVVPSPAALALLGVGGLVGAARRRR